MMQANIIHVSYKSSISKTRDQPQSCTKIHYGADYQSLYGYAYIAA
jgi:hypothetical protein